MANNQFSMINSQSPFKSESRRTNLRQVRNSQRPLRQRRHPRLRA